MKKIKGKFGAKLNFQRDGVGVQPKTPSMGLVSMDICWNNSSSLLIAYKYYFTTSHERVLNLTLTRIDNIKPSSLGEVRDRFAD